MQRIKFQLYEGIGAFPRGPMITASGGVAYVAAVGDAAKQAITDEAGASLTNPIALTTGGVTFYVPDGVASVDLYIQCPGGQFVVRKAVVPGAEPDIAVDVSKHDQTMVIPFSIDDTVAATETATGFVLPKCLVLPTPFIDVLTVDATESMDVGTDSGDSGDADGFLAVVLTSVAGLVAGQAPNGAVTLGALLVTDEDGAGALIPSAHVSLLKEITYTLTAGTDLAEGFIHLPIHLAAA